MEPTTHAYGPSPDQYGELSRPARARPGVVVVVHGGFWRAPFDASAGRPLAADLARRGWVAWNVEYRRIGAGGGWPTTFEDVGAAFDVLARLDVDLSAVAALGHSAGGHLAAWAAARPGLAPGVPGGPARVPVSAVVAQAGLLDLRRGALDRLGAGAVDELLGGTPAEVPERYAVADPRGQVPLPVPVVCVHSRRDRVVPFGQSADYVAAASAAGGRAELVKVRGDHWAHLDPATGAWRAVVAALERIMPP